MNLSVNACCHWMRNGAQDWPICPGRPKTCPKSSAARSRRCAALVREYLFVSLYKACAESLASENASRLAAMQRAEKNIDELVGALNQTFHRLRQTSIDEEFSTSSRLSIFVCTEQRLATRCKSP